MQPSNYYDPWAPNVGFWKAEKPLVPKKTFAPFWNGAISKKQLSVEVQEHGYSETEKMRQYRYELLNWAKYLLASLEQFKGIWDAIYYWQSAEISKTMYFSANIFWRKHVLNIHQTFEEDAKLMTKISLCTVTSLRTTMTVVAVNIVSLQIAVEPSRENHSANWLRVSIPKYSDLYKMDKMGNETKNVKKLKD